MRYLVERTPGPGWDHSRARRRQAGWDAHAAFMDALVDEGVVLLGGPAGDAEDDPAVTVWEADGEAAIRARLAEDPWGEDMLATVSIRAWHLWLRRPGND
jgi:uncharacterized protein